MNEFMVVIMSDEAHFNLHGTMEDLPVCGYFLWGDLKTKVYQNKPDNIQELKTSICQEIAVVRKQMLGWAMQNFEERLQKSVYRKKGITWKMLFFGCW